MWSTGWPAMPVGNRWDSNLRSGPHGPLNRTAEMPSWIGDEGSWPSKSTNVGFEIDQITWTGESEKGDPKSAVKCKSLSLIRLCDEKRRRLVQIWRFWSKLIGFIVLLFRLQGATSRLTFGFVWMVSTRSRLGFPFVF